MANTHIHLDDINVLEEYRHKLEHWKRELYRLNDEIRIYHDSLEQDKRWYGHSHVQFWETHIGSIYNQHFQPVAEKLDVAQRDLHQLQSKAEELGIR